MKYYYVIMKFDQYGNEEVTPITNQGKIGWSIRETEQHTMFAYRYDTFAKMADAYRRAKNAKH
jgi:hypothetical protein